MYDRLKTGSPFSVLRSPFSVLGKLTLTGLCLALLTTISFSFSSCGGDGSSPGIIDDTIPPTPQTISYGGVAGGVAYSLAITENTDARAAYAPQNGDAYILTVYSNPEKKSSGTVTVGGGGKLTLAPKSNSGSTFSITVGDGGITAMSGTITFDDGKTESAPATIEPVSELGTLTITGIPAKYNGNYVWGEMNGHRLSFAGHESYTPLPQIKDGKVILKAYTYDVDGEYNFYLYTGNETFTYENENTKGLFEIVIYSSQTPFKEDGSAKEGVGVMAYISKKTTSTTFKNGAATLSISDLEVHPEA